jgi:hypothetical protein
VPEIVCEESSGYLGASSSKLLEKKTVDTPFSFLSVAVIAAKITQIFGCATCHKIGDHLLFVLDFCCHHFCFDHYWL